MARVFGVRFFDFDNLFSAKKISLQYFFFLRQSFLSDRGASRSKISQRERGQIAFFATRPYLSRAIRLVVSDDRTDCVSDRDHLEWCATKTGFSVSLFLSLRMSKYGHTRVPLFFAARSWWHVEISQAKYVHTYTRVRERTDSVDSCCDVTRCGALSLSRLYPEIKSRGKLDSIAPSKLHSYRVSGRRFAKATKSTARDDYPDITRLREY